MKMGKFGRGTLMILSSLLLAMGGLLWGAPQETIASSGAFDIYVSPAFQVVDAGDTVTVEVWIDATGIASSPVTGEAVGTGNGFTKTFKLKAGLTPPAHPSVVPDSQTISLDGTPTAAYTIDYAKGEITLDAAPGAGEAITADYDYWDDFFDTVDFCLDYDPDTLLLVDIARNAELFASSIPDPTTPPGQINFNVHNAGVVPLPLYAGAKFKLATVTFGALEVEENTITAIDLLDRNGLKTCAYKKGETLPGADIDGQVFALVTTAIILNPEEGFAATTISGYKFASNSPVTISWAGTEVPTFPANVVSDGNGQFTAFITVPDQTTPGDYTIEATDGVDSATATFTVIDIKGPQGDTGDKGDKGDAGPEGPQGDPGAAAPIAIPIVAIVFAVLALAAVVMWILRARKAS